MKGIYLASCKARHYDYDIVYQDIDDKYNCDIGGDMMDVDLSSYDFIIASPPCNYYSRANYRRNISSYALSTKHLLPGILKKLALLKKPFIVENVRNYKLFEDNGIFDICDKYNLNVYFVGRHTYFTNVSINLNCFQEFDFHDSNYAKKHCIKIERQSYRQGGDNVHRVIEIWLNAIVNNSWQLIQTNIFDFL